jgi:hypothetical protein
MERLEPRTLLSGDVAAIVNDDGDLKITGDDAGNQIVLDQAGLSGGQVRITPTNGTTINGSGDAAVLSGITDDWFITTGAGSDSITLTDVTAGDRIVIKTNGGNNMVTATSPTTGGNFDITNGDGDDTVNICGPTTGGRLLIDNRNGNNNTTIDGICPSVMPPTPPTPPPPDDIGRDLIVKGRGGTDVVTLMDGLAIRGETKIDSGGGVNALSVANILAEGEFIGKSQGDQTVTVTASTFGDELEILTFGGSVDVSITGATLTPMNGVPIRLSEIEIITPNGSNTVAVNNSSMAGDLHVIGGGGTIVVDTVTIGRKLEINTSTGTTLVLDTVASLGTTMIDGSNDMDTTFIDDSTFVGSFKVRARGGNDMLNIEQVAATTDTVLMAGTVSINMGDGDDTVTSGIAGSATNAVVFQQATTVDGGSGVNTLIAPASANVFLVEPVVKNFQTVNT